MTTYWLETLLALLCLSGMVLAMMTVIDAAVNGLERGDLARLFIGLALTATTIYAIREANADR